jgi:hypothetical protein
MPNMFNLLRGEEALPRNWKLSACSTAALLTGACSPLFPVVHNQLHGIASVEGEVVALV